MADVGAVPVGARVLTRVARLVDRIVPPAAGVLVFVLSVAAVQGFLGFLAVWHSPWLLAAAALCGVVAWLGRWRRWPLFVVAVPAAGALLLWPVAAVACYYAATSLRGRRLGVFVVGAIGCYLASVMINALIGGYRAYWAGPANAVLTLLLFVLLPLVVGLWVNARRQLLAELADRADRARVAERSRIAREMHDILAHRVSLMVLHAGAIEVTATDERIVGEAGVIRSTGREALTNLREVLGVLRVSDAPTATGPEPTLADVDELITASRTAGVPVTWRTEGTPVPVPETVQRTVYRVVQEALTNVHKHAGRARTEVTMGYLPGRLVVAVRNDQPAGPVPAASGSGLGLVGLRERVALLGGSCRSGTHADGGFMVRAELPVPAAERDRSA